MLFQITFNNIHNKQQTTQNTKHSAIHQGCDLVQKCLDTMYNSYNELFERLTDVCNDIITKQSEWELFINEVIPFTEDTKQGYLAKRMNYKHVCMFICKLLNIMIVGSLLLLIISKEIVGVSKNIENFN